MINVDQNYTREKKCEYKNEIYRVRDNGAILRLSRDGKPKRPKDDVWTFGEKIDRGYAKFCGESVHRIVAFAFLGEPPTKQHVVDHIDTNRQNNRPENLRWLTKLENILLNPYTRAKIEYWCGSIESFLEDPTQLQGHEGEEANFAWMRAVTSEEAQSTLTNWEKLFSKPRPVSLYKENSIEEWIFGCNQQVNTQSELFDKQLLHYEKEDETPIRDNQISDSDSNISLSNTVDLRLSKKEFMTAMVEICKTESWQYKKYYKTNDWKTDLLITADGHHCAVSVFNSITTASQCIPLIEKDGVTALCFILSPKNEVNAEIPCFGLHKTGESLNVSLTNQQISLHSFVRNVMDEKIVHQTKTKITAVDVMFVGINCFFCSEPHSVFFVRYLIDKYGLRHDYAEMTYGYHEEKINLPDLQFGEDIVNDVNQYIKNHPQKRILMGEIKERYSRTMDCSYMSFGCPKCDGIVGDHYLNNIGIDVAYETDETLMHRITLSSTFDLPINVWKLVELI